MTLPKSTTAQAFFPDEQKVNFVDPEEAYRDVWNDGDDLTFQVVQELFQFVLISRHSDIKAMDSIFWGHVKLLSYSDDVSDLAATPRTKSANGIKQISPITNITTTPAIANGAEVSNGCNSKKMINAMNNMLP